MRELIAQICLEQHNRNKHLYFGDFEVSQEGIATALVADVGHSLHGAVTRVKGWTEGVKKKRAHINEIADDLIEWLKDEDKDNKNLELDMGSFKTWLKTSEIGPYRYYYLLNDSIYNKMVAELKSGNSSELEDATGHFLNDQAAINLGISADMKDRKSATRMIDNLRTIKDLMVFVTKYRARTNIIFDLLEKRSRAVKGFPYQLMLSGISDLRVVCKKVVNLAT